jgi:hypothetical protein
LLILTVDASNANRNISGAPNADDSVEASERKRRAARVAVRHHCATIVEFNWYR